ncbi:MAG: hypothetical protein ACRC4H_09420 [Plesiomonas sp.]
MATTNNTNLITVNAKEVDASQYFSDTRQALTGVNAMVQNSAYLAAYHLTAHFNLTLVQQCFNKLCVIDGTVNVTLFDNLQAWFGVYFDAAKAEQCIKGYPITIKREMDNETGDESVSVTWVQNDKGDRKNPLPDSKVQMLADKMMSVLEQHANSYAVTTAAKQRKADSKKSAEKAAEEQAEKMSPVEKQAAEEKTKRDNKDKAFKSISRSVDKAAEKIIENGGTADEIYEMLIRLANTFKSSAPRQTDDEGNEVTLPQASETVTAE